MAVAPFEMPVIQDQATMEIPKIKPGSMAHMKSFIAAKPVQDFMGYPHELADDWKERAIEKNG